MKQPKCKTAMVKLKDVLDAIPDTWLDPLLSGKDAVVRTPFGCGDIERLLQAVKKRIERLGPPKDKLTP